MTDPSPLIPDPLLQVSLHKLIDLLVSDSRRVVLRFGSLSTQAERQRLSKSESTEVAMPMSKRAAAEFFGTFWLVFGGCGSAVIAAGFPAVGIGFAGVALAFGLTVLTMAFAIGHISGCHLNPAVSLGLVVGKRFPAKDLPAYIIAQVAGAIAAAGVLYVIASGTVGFNLSNGFALNGYA